MKVKKAKKRLAERFRPKRLKGRYAVVAMLVLLVLATGGIYAATMYFGDDSSQKESPVSQEPTPVNEAADEEAAVEEQRNQEAREVYQSALDVINSDNPNETELAYSYVTAAYYAAFFKEDQAKEYATKALEMHQPPDLEGHPGPEEQKQQEMRDYEETKKDMELIKEGKYDEAYAVDAEQ